MAGILVLALVVVPLVEIYLLLQVGQVLGTLPTIVLLVAMSVIGAMLLRREGSRTWLAFRTATSAGRVPAKEVADGALVIFGGALLLTPGFATDVVGLLCVLPGSRAVVRRLLTAFAARRFGVAGVAGAFAVDRMSARRSGAPPRPGRPGGVVDGSVVEGSVVEDPVVEGTGDDPGEGPTGRRPG